MNLIVGVGFGILSMLGFGFGDFLIAKFSRRTSAFATSMGISIFQLILLFFMAMFLFSYNGMQPLTIALIALTGLASATGSLSLTKGLRDGDVSVITPIVSSWGAVTAILGVTLLQESINAMQVLYICMIIAGTVLVSMNLKNLFDSDSRRVYIGISYAVACLVSWGLYFFFISILTESLGWFSAAFLSAIPRFILLLLFGSLAGIKARFSKKQTVPLLVISLLTLAGTFTYNLGVTYYSTYIIAPISAASAVVTVVLALAFLRERVSDYQKLGIALSIAGLILLSA